ncbi:MAG: methylmalonyl Co-A mutase-associated GTPase MeaB [Gammaproteobacteria bacterium]|nr:methylmalonyl Co-A mutase-associated GTPase MeaB [Gammaproteobacteria bacterium]
MTDPAALAARLLDGDRAALARVITLIQRDPRAAAALDPLLAPATGRAYTIGVTGAPGAGKSTLVGAMLLDALGRGQSTAVIALDPESPLTGGAILGDRLRMERAAIDDRVFLRSVTADARGGGLSAAAPLIVRALDAAGWPWIVLETVGVGQSELAIAEAAATTIVVLTPGAGDEVQAIKAGLMEIADVFVINKADHPGVAATRRDVEQAIAHARGRAWRPVLVEAVATDGRGIAPLWDAVFAHRAHLEATQALADQRRRFLKLAVRTLAARALDARLEAWMNGESGRALIERVERGEASLPGACAEALGGLQGGAASGSA